MTKKLDEPITPSVDTSTSTSAPVVSISQICPKFQQVMLTGGQENPPVSTIRTGSAVVVYTNDSCNEVQIEIAAFGFDPPSGPNAITSAHVHVGAIGVNGLAIRTFPPSTFVFENGVYSISAIWKSSDSEPFTSDFMTKLNNGGLYINLHTATNPGGEIRGQILFVGALPPFTT